MNNFLHLLKQLHLEEAMMKSIHPNVNIILNGKERRSSKNEWMRYIKTKVLNRFNRVVQFDITNVEIDKQTMSFHIFMACRKYNGEWFFTEIHVNNIWKNNRIIQTEYKTINF